MAHRGKSGSVLGKFGWNQVKKNQDQQLDETGRLKTWIHPENRITETFVTYHAKYLGCTEVNKPKGVDVVKDAIKKLRISYEMKKSESGNKGSKLQKVEINLNIESVKVVDAKTKAMICTRPLHRVSYCADDHADKKLFAFIAKDQDTKKHNCFVFLCEKEAAELTLSFGQVFQMAYKRYIEKEKKETQKNNDLVNLEKQIEEMKKENDHLKKELSHNNKKTSPNNYDDKKEVFSFHRNNYSTLNSESDAVPPQTPTTPFTDFQSLSNPHPVSPGIQPLNNDNGTIQANLFDANFATVQTAGSNSQDLFDPFSNFDGTKTVVVDSKTSHDGGGISLFPRDTDNTTNSIDLFQNLSTSPKEEDFQTKFDPFADVPDWQSVASEETSNSASNTNVNPFVNDIPPQQNNNNNNFNPFGFEQTDQMFVNNEIVTTESKGNFSDYGNDNAEQDLFSRYLSNVVASRDSSEEQTKSESNTHHHHHQNSSDAVGNTTQNSSSSNGFNPFSNDQSTNNSLFDTDFNQLSINETNNNNSQLPFVNGNTSNLSFDGKSEQQQQQMFRPRPSANNKTTQGLPAPPSKHEIKSIKPPPPPQLNSKRMTKQASLPASPSANQQQFTTQPGAFKEQIISSSHTLPNVRRGQSVDQVDIKSRSRTTSTHKVPPLTKSISEASKSLDDLSDSSRSSFNPFSAPVQL